MQRVRGSVHKRIFLSADRQAILLMIFDPTESYRHEKVGRMMVLLRTADLLCIRSGSGLAVLTGQLLPLGLDGGRLRDCEQRHMRSGCQGRQFTDCGPDTAGINQRTGNR